MTRPSLDDLPFIRGQQVPGFPMKLYGAPTPDGPWFRLTKHEVTSVWPRYYAAIQQQRLSQNETPAH